MVITDKLEFFNFDIPKLILMDIILTRVDW